MIQKEDFLPNRLVALWWGWWMVRLARSRVPSSNPTKGSSRHTTADALSHEFRTSTEATKSFPEFPQQRKLAMEPCSLCWNDNSALSRPNLVLEIPNVGSFQCSFIQSLTPSILLNESSTECDQVRAVAAPLCGCQLPFAESSCLICPQGDANKKSISTIDDLSIPSAFSLASIIGLDNTTLFPLLNSLTEEEPTCELLQLALLSYDMESDVCTEFSSFEPCTSLCSRARPTTDEPPVVITEQPNTKGSNSTTDKQCSMCLYDSDDSSLVYDRIIPNLFPPPITVTCGLLADSVAALVPESKECTDAQQLGVYCGCPPPTENPCKLCENIPFPDQVLDWNIAGTDFTPTCAVFSGILESTGLDASDEQCRVSRGVGAESCGCPPIAKTPCEFCPGGIPPENLNQLIYDENTNCGFIQSSGYSIEDGSWSCYFFQNSAHVCGCRGGFWNYFGTKNVLQQQILAWAPRPMAFLSIIGSSAILYEAFARHKRPRSMYLQLMISISIMDILSSLGWIVSTSAIPKVMRNGIDNDTYGAAGTEATCKAQALAIQLGGSSVWFNVALTVYYKLVIVDGWKESKFTTKIRALFLLLPAALGGAIAIAGYPYYDWNSAGCAIRFIPLTENWKHFTGLVLIPGMTAIFLVTIITIYTFRQFRKTRAKSSQWRFSSRETTSTTVSTVSGGRLKERLFGSGLEARVLRQSMFYLMAFYASFPIAFVGFVLTIFKIINYPLFLCIVMLSPIQGFNNAFVFFRPRVMKRYDEWATRRRSIRDERTASPSNNETTVNNDNTNQTANEDMIESTNKEDEAQQMHGEVYEEEQHQPTREEAERSAFLESHFFNLTPAERHIDQRRLNRGQSEPFLSVVGSFILPKTSRLPVNGDHDGADQSMGEKSG